MILADFDPATHLADLAIPEVVSTAITLVDTEQAVWIADPEVDDVFGLVERGTQNAYVILYAPTTTPYWDFETSERFDRMMWSDR